jgi:hypothetical protein
MESKASGESMAKQYRRLPFKTVGCAVYQLKREVENE